jgi:hypothetical protein
MAWRLQGLDRGSFHGWSDNRDEGD